MQFQSHYAELRKRLIFVFILFILVMLLSLVFDSYLYRYLTEPVIKSGLNLMAFGPGEIVSVLFTLAGWTSIGLCTPFALFQFWRFAVPGLHKKERQLISTIVFMAALMFIIGILFAWFIVFPRILEFLIVLTKHEGMGIVLQASSYFSFLIGICLPFGFAFEGPLVMSILAKFGLIHATSLRRIRKYAYLVIVIIGVLISPPEFISHLSVTMPMMLLYEFSIGLVAWIEHRQKPIVQTKDECKSLYTP